MIERLVRWSLSNRPVIYALSLLLTLGGLVLALRTPVDVLPDLTAPTVTVVVDAGGYTPTEVEQRVTIPLETALNGSPGLRRIRSNSATGLSVVTLEFGWTTSPAEARRITSERLQTVGDELPEDLPAPHMTPGIVGYGRDHVSSHCVPPTLRRWRSKAWLTGRSSAACWVYPALPTL